MIAAVVIPHFLAAVLGSGQAVPLVITTEAGRRVLATCARAAGRGVQPGMTPRQAGALCPQAEMVAYDLTRHREAVARLLTVLATFTDHAEHEAVHDLMRRRNRSTRSADTRQIAVFYADLGRLTLTATLRLAGQLRAAVGREITAGMGLAATKFAAFAAAAVAEPGQLQVVPEEDAPTFLASLPIALLWLDAETHRRLTLLGLKTLGHLAGLTRSAVYAQFGRRGVRCWELAQGIDPRPVDVYRPRHDERLTWSFDAPLLHRGALEAVLRTLAAELAARVRTRGVMGATVLLTAVLGDHSRRTVTRALRQPIASEKAITEAFLEAFTRIHPGGHGVAGLELTLADVVPFAGVQLPLFAQPGTHRDRLNGALASLTARFGSEVCAWIQPAERHALLPESRYQFTPVRS
jgi:DNA polymerase-4